jgi:hypothetical protein
VAPPAGERAAFEKDRGADAGAVVNGKAADIEDQTRISQGQRTTSKVILPVILIKFGRLWAGMSEK